MLKGDNIQLRAMEPSDLEVLYLWENDEESWLVSQTIVPFSKHLLQQFMDTAHLDIYTNKQLRLMIDYTEDGMTKTIGCIDLFNFDVKNKRAGVGILIGDYSVRQKGLAAKALNLFINYCFTQFAFHYFRIN
jgi:diamine N-acetyltransferase